MTKTEFVRSVPKDTPAAKVVDMAKAKGMKLSTQYVYVIRSTTKKSKPNGKGKHPGPKKAKKAYASPTEGELMEAVLELGLSRSLKLINSMMDKLRS